MRTDHSLNWGDEKLSESRYNLKIVSTWEISEKEWRSPRFVGRRSERIELPFTEMGQLEEGQVWGKEEIKNSLLMR